MLEPTAKDKPAISYTWRELGQVVLVVVLLFLGFLIWNNWKNYMDHRLEFYKLQDRVLQLELDKCKCKEK
jgi:predicted negative regulator of RcsB-dependent stress response